MSWSYYRFLFRCQFIGQTLPIKTPPFGTTHGIWRRKMLSIIGGYALVYAFDMAQVVERGLAIWKMVHKEFNRRALFPKLWLTFKRKLFFVHTYTYTLASQWISNWITASIYYTCCCCELSRGEDLKESADETIILQWKQLDTFVRTPATKPGFGPALSLFHWETEPIPMEGEAITTDLRKA